MSSLKDHKRIDFIVPYPFDVAPGQRFRYEQYLPALRSAGFLVTMHPFLSRDTHEILYQKGRFVRKAWGVLAGFVRRFVSLPIYMKADFIFIFREAAPLGPPIIEWILTRVMQKKVIYDFDDAIWLPNTSHENKIISWLKWHSKVKSICTWSYRVSCGNNFLREFAWHYNQSVVLNPTTIDTNAVHNPVLYEKRQKNNPEQIVIGWTGTHSTMKYLNFMEQVIHELQKKNPSLEFVVISDRKPTLDISSLRFIPWSKKNEVACLLDFDIGIMPLTDDQWAQGKCGLKALQYMAMEVPVVASPIGVNLQIIDQVQTGLLASSAEEWVSCLTTLLADAPLRNIMGKEGRRKVIRDYSVNSNTENFISLFKP